MPSGHRVLEKIDRAKPYFTRRITQLSGGVTTGHLLEVWLPVESAYGGWIAAVTIDGLGLPDMSAMPGEDPLDALLCALRFVRGLLDENDGTFIFGVWAHGKLPETTDWELA